MSALTARPRWIVLVLLLLVSVYAFHDVSSENGDTASKRKPDYTLVAKMATYDVDLKYKPKDSKAVVDVLYETPPGPDDKVGRFKFLTRSWTKDGVVDDNMLGPILEFRPGQHFEILVVNELHETGDYENLGPREPTASSWLPFIDQKNGRYAGIQASEPVNFAFLNSCTPDTPLSEFEIDTENMPKNFNYTNLHLHGLEVIPHLFEPQGTTNPKADYITIKPGEKYLYKFDLPEDHPTGTFWYHPHRHNSVAMQAWGAMAGLVYIRGITDDELKDTYNITREIPFAVHDPHYRIEAYPTETEPGIAKTASFLRDQTDQSTYMYLVTGEFSPTYTLKKNEVVRLRMLIATAENAVGFRIVPENTALKKTVCNEGAREENCPFYVMASDGITYDKPVEKNLLVMAGGERHDLLLSFSEPGDYVIKSDYIDTIQWFGTGPPDQDLATIRVTDEDAGPLKTQIADMRFTPGIPDSQSIMPKEITRKRHIVFDIETDSCVIPFPQYTVNGKRYEATDVSFTATQGDVEEWVLISPNKAGHPFHIHVNSFQLKERSTALEPDPTLVAPEDMATVKSRIEAMASNDPAGQWRDTALIPPQGYIRIWTRLYSKYVGKTVFHCHFLAHEETSMIQNFLIEEPKSQ